LGNKIYKLTIAIMLLVIVLFFLINSILGPNIVEAKEVPTKELVSLVKNIEHKEIIVNKEQIENEESEAKEESEEIVFDGLTLQQLADKLESFMPHELDGYGYKFASYATSLGLDPYLCLGIVLEETGCTWGCSRLVKNCNNIGGQKGSGCGEYQSFDSIEAGIEGFLNNVYKNYFLYGLTTADTMNPKYAENPLWSKNVNAYIAKIKNS